jgi:hypothetical protein
MDTDHRLADVDWSTVSAFSRLGLDGDIDEIELTDVEEIEEVQRLFE